MTADEDRIRGMIRSSAWLMRVLATVRDAGLPDAWVGGPGAGHPALTDGRTGLPGRGPGSYS